MQRSLKEFDKNNHDIFRAITVRPDIAESLINGQIEGFITSKKKRLSGEVMLVSETGRGVGHLAAFAKIKEVVPLEKMSFEDVQELIGDRVELLNSLTPTDPVFVVRFSKVQRVIELPVFIPGKVWDLVMDKEDVFIYPDSQYLKIKNLNQKEFKKLSALGLSLLGSGLILGSFLVYLIAKKITEFAFWVLDIK